MDARGITAAMRGRWFGHYGYVKCVSHEDSRPSLRLRDGERGHLLVFCHAGCPPREILSGLRARGVLGDVKPEDAVDPQITERAVNKRREHNAVRAGSIWKECQRIDSTTAADYLRRRGITLPLPPSLRFHPQIQHPDNNHLWPAIVGAVQNIDRKITGIHRTYLVGDGRKAGIDNAKISLGSLSGGSVRLAHAAETLAIGEGIETCLSYMQIYGTPIWAALSTAGMQSIMLPKEVRTVRIAMDMDENGAGETAAMAAKARFEAEGRAVEIAKPVAGYKDFNDMVMHGRRPV